MAQTYTRQSSFSDGDTITAALFNNEYNQLVNAFSYSSSDASSTGHRHDGTAGQGGNIHTIGDLDFLNKIVVDSTNNRWGFYVEVSAVAVEQIRIQDGAIVPVTDDDIDLGTSSLEFKNIYIDGTAKVDTLTVDENATIAGTLGVTGATTLSSTLGVTGAATLSSTLAVTGTSTLTGNVTTTNDLSVGGNLTVTGNATIAGNLTFGDAATDTVAFSADVASNLLPSADNTYDLGASGSEWKDLYIDGTANIDSLVADTVDINGGSIDAVTLGTNSAVTEAQVDNININGNAIISTDTNGNIDLTPNGTGEVNISKVDIDSGAIDGTTVGAASASTGAFTTLTASTSLNIASSTTVDGVLDEDNMASDSATKLATQQSIKAYVDSQIGANNELSEVLSNGNTTGGTDINFGDNDKAVFGAGSDLQIYHDGSNSYIKDAGTGGIIIDSYANFTLGGSIGGSLENYLTAVGNGAVSLYYDNAAKLATTSTGIDVTGDITLGDTNPTITFNDSSVTNLSHSISSASDNLRIMADVNGVDAGSRVEIFDGTTEVARFEAGAVDVTGTVTADGLTVDGGANLLTRTSSGAEVDVLEVRNNATAASTASTIKFVNSTAAGSNSGSSELVAVRTGTNTGDFKIRTSNSTGSMIDRLLVDSGGDISFYEDTGTTAQIVWDASADALTFKDSVKATFGAGSDLQIYHDGTNNYVDAAGVGHLYLQSQGVDKDVKILSDDGSDGLVEYFRADGSLGQAQLYYYGDKKLNTISTGIDVTGTVTADELHVQQAGFTSVLVGSTGAGGAMLILDGDSNGDGAGGDYSYVYHTTAGQLEFQQNSPSGTNEMLFKTAGNNLRMKIGSGGDISFYEDTGTTPKLFWDASAESLGIGGTPTSPLHVFGDARLEEASPTITLVDTTDSSTHLVQSINTALNIQGAGQVRISTSATERMRIDASGSFLVGTTSSGFNGQGLPLVVGSGSSNTGMTIYSGTTGYGTIQFADAVTTGADSYRGVISYKHDDEFMYFSTNATERMRIDSSGNVGLKNSSPSSYSGDGADLVIGTTSGDNGLSIISGTSGTGNIYFGDVEETGTGSRRGQIVYDHASDHMRFATAASEAMRIDASGNVKIGTGDNRFSFLTATTANLQIDGGIVFEPGSGNNAEIINYRSTDMLFGNSGTERMRITSSGSVGIGVVPSAWLAGGNLEFANGANIGGGNYFRIFSNSYIDSGSVIRYKETAPALRYQMVNGSHIWENAASGTAGNAVTFTQAMTLDASGNLLVGKTSADYTTAGVMAEGDGTISAVKAGTTGVFNRLTSDGDILQFRKDGTTVGSIGANLSNMVIGFGNAGVKFGSGASAIIPHSLVTNLDVDDAIDLGTISGSTRRFRDLYLSGTGYIGTSAGINTTSPDGLVHVYNGMLQVGSKTGDTSVQQNTNAIRIAAVPDSTTEWGGLQWYREFSDVIGAEIIASRPGAAEADTDLIFKTSTDASNAVERMRITHGGNLELNGSAGPILKVISTATGTPTAFVYASANGADFGSLTNDPVRFFQNNGEVGRFDTSGNLIVGKTSTSQTVEGIVLQGADGRLNASADGNVAGIFNRLTDDGDIFLFRKDGTTVGSIGTKSNDLTIGTGDTGIQFYDFGNSIVPTDLTTNTNIDATIDLGLSGTRFKDLYLSGGVYVGGTGAANKLDDYEEGTWTPVTNSGSWTVNSASYTKVGNMVTCRFKVTATATIAVNDFTGLPFTPAADSGGICSYQNSESGEVYSILVQTSNVWNFRVASTQKGLVNGALVSGAFTYETAA